jgi:hypothetical protein
MPEDLYILLTQTVDQLKWLNVSTAVDATVSAVTLACMVGFWIEMRNMRK